MRALKRSRIAVPLISIMAAFAFSAQAQEQQHKPPPQGQARPATPAVRSAAPPRTGQARAKGQGQVMRGPQGQGQAMRGPPGQGQAMRGPQGPQGQRVRAMHAAISRHVISAVTPIAAGWPGKADGGVTRCTMAATAGGGTSAASGISTRSRWTALRPMSRTSRSMDDVAGVDDDAPGGPGAGLSAAAAAYAPPPPPAPRSGGQCRRRRNRWRRSRWLDHRPASRRCRGRRHGRHHWRDCRSPGRGASRLLSRARQLLLQVSVRTVRSGRSAQLLLTQLSRNRIASDTGEIRLAGLK